MLVFRKMLMALTGLFICLFLTVHLGGNLILLLPEARAQPLYNAYSLALGGNPFIMVIAYVNYACFLLHIAYGIVISLRNGRSRARGYERDKRSENSTWTSQNMGLLGSALFAFLVLHLANFWYRVKFSDHDGDLYQMASDLFHQPLYAVLYALSMIPLGLHLSHGISSAFRSLGFYNRRYLLWIARISLGYSMVVTIGFAVIPIVMYMR